MPDAIIDAHHHIWRLAQTPWLNGPPLPRIFGDYKPLRRDYTIEEFLAEAGPCGVVKSVFVQVNVAPGEEVDEVGFVQSVADRAGFPQGISGFADLSAPDVDEVLERECAFRNLRGVRQQLHWHEKPLYRFAARPDIMADPGWRRGLRAVERRGLVFELQIFPGQMQAGLDLARSFPGLTFVLLHAGMPEDRSETGLALWRRGMAGLAGCDNVMVKISGLGTFERSCSEASWRPIIEETVDRFGPSRCLFGSNFPIEKLWTDYAHLVEVVQACLSRSSPEERRAVLHDTAARVYRI
jgi:predicted TIM-barrel fold metal-dependent hydrolase